MDILQYHISIDLLLNHIKRISLNIDNSTQNSYFVHNFFHNKSFFVQQCGRRLFPRKRDIKKQAKKYYQINKEKLQKRLQVYYKDLSEDEKIKKNMVTEIKTCQWQIQKEKNNILKMIAIQ